MPVIDVIEAAKTPEQRRMLKEVAQQKQEIKNIWTQVDSLVKRIGDFTFKCPLSNGAGGKFSAQDVFDAWGKDAVSLCETGDAAIALLTAVAIANTPAGQTPATVPAVTPAGMSVTRNADGTVTVATAGTASVAPVATFVAQASGKVVIPAGV